ncbi:hypothetical protein DH2020_046945 [Rehmannia glutinosa]|uniref:Uncharacterized protein n=1 Tax=Rehmannia glutinosa TaxID=99300 RepID=A0ABR0UAT2_REHGL
MATKPGVLTDWPWKNLGSFKYIILAPWAMQSLYSVATKEKNERDYLNLMIIPFLITRALHNQIWISFSRHRTAKGNNRILDKTIEFEQVDRESNCIFLLFTIPLLGTILTGTASMVSLYGYVTYIDLMNNMGHCNFEFIPNWAFSIFPPLKYLMYTPSFHSLHHTQFRTNYSLFMPFYDYIHGTMDKSTDALHETSLKRQGDFPDVIHLTHLTTPESIFHLQVGFASFASRPQNSKWYMWPLTFWSMLLNFIYGRTFIVERNLFEELKLQSWAIPRYTIQYSLKWQRQAINGLIEEAILEAELRGAKGEELNRSGAIFIEKHPKLNIKLVDGSSLAVALVLNTIPKGTTEILFRGKLSKIAFAIVSALCQKGIKVATLYQNEKLKLAARSQSNNVLVSKSYTQKIWIVGDGLTEDEQLNAPKGTLFIPFSQFPPKKTRNDAVYCHTPSMFAPPSLQNLHSCENWLPRRVMSAWRVAGIVHALQGWNVNECGDSIFDSDKIWEAALKHGFRPTTISK